MTTLQGRLTRCEITTTVTGQRIANLVVRQPDGRDGRAVMWDDFGNGFSEAVWQHVEFAWEQAGAQGHASLEAAEIGVVMEGYRKKRTWRGGEVWEFQVTKVTAASADLSFVIEMVRPSRAEAA